METFARRIAPFIFVNLSFILKSTAIMTIALDAGRSVRVAISLMPSMTAMSRDASIRIGGLAEPAGSIFGSSWAGPRRAYPRYDPTPIH
jgi:hypothetical protein